MEDVQVKIQLMIEVMDRQLTMLNMSLRSFYNYIRRNTIANKKLITTMLSIMFTAQKLNFIFMGLIQPSLALVGIWDVWNTILGVVFLPIALWLLDNVFLPLMQYLINLPPNVQMVIGAFVAFGAAITAVVALGANLILLLSQLFGYSSGIVFLGEAFASISPFILPIITILGFVIAAVIGFVSAWKSNFADIQGWVQVIVAGIKQMFTGFKQFLDGDITDALKNIWGGWVKIFVGILTILGVSITKFLLDILTKFYDWGVKVVDNIVAGILSNGSKIMETIEKFLPPGLGKIMLGFASAGMEKLSQDMITPVPAPSSTGQQTLNQLMTPITVNLKVTTDTNLHIKSGVPMTTG